MLEISPFALGIAISLLGLILFLVALFTARALLNNRPKPQASTDLQVSVDQAEHDEAVLLIQAGGRLIYINEQARLLFSHGDNNPGLEHITRRARPQNALLELCAKEGKANFTVGGCAIEGTSYNIPYGTSRAMLVSLHQSRSTFEAADSSDKKSYFLSAQAYTLINELSKKTSGSLDLETNLIAILESIERFSPSDRAEITIWDAEKRHMIPYRLSGDPESGHHLAKSDGSHSSTEMFTGYLVTNRMPLLITDTDTENFVNQDNNPGQITFKSYLGLPLEAGEELVGTLVLASLSKDKFTGDELEILRMFSNQAATAIRNALLYKEEQRRAQDLSDLARLSQAVRNQHDPEGLFAHLLERIKPLIEVEILGFLIYEEEQHTLQGQAPFLGLHSDIIEWTHCIIQPGSEAEKVWISQRPIITSDAPLDPNLQAFNLDRLAQAAGIRHMVLTPLTCNNHMLGYLLAADKCDGSTFDQSDQHLLMIISGQVASTIENAKLSAENLVLSLDLDQRVSSRTTELAREHQRTETLLRIITELSASLDLEHVLNRTLHVLNENVNAEHLSVLILRPGEEKLRHLASAGYVDILHTSEGRVTAFDPGQGLAGWVIANSKPALIPNLLEDPRWTQFPETASEHRSAIGVPLVIGEETLGALLLFHREIDRFSPDQLDLVRAAANQMSIAVNNAELYRLIRDQAEDLGHMFREQQIETSRSQAILEAVADGVIVTDANMHITLFNAAAEQILGLKRSQIIGKSLQQFSGLFGHAAESWMGTIQKWSQDPTSYQAGEIYTEQITLEDDRVVSVHLSPVSMRDSYLGTVSTFRDITLQVEVDHLKSDFVATVSHELRTPMTSIRGYVDILLMGAAGELNEQQTQFLNIVKGNTKQLTILVNDLLDISRIEAGHVTLSLQPLNLNDLANEAVSALNHLAEDNNKAMQIEYEPHMDIPLALGDRERVRQILNNLLENAFHYTPENGKITLEMQQIDNEVLINIVDTGIGIPSDVQPQVFERFYRGEHPYVLATSGTGLGLAIVQYLVEMHNGRIWIESSGMPGEGTTFSFTLPVY